MLSSPHAEIIDTLHEWYTLLSTLAAIKPSLVRHPPHSSGTLNAQAARAAGYADEAVALLQELPYLDVGDHEMFLELLPSTFPLSYLGDLDQGYFESCREMQRDEMMPSTAVKLTRSEIYGVVFVYDVGTSKWIVLIFLVCLWVGVYEWMVFSRTTHKLSRNELSQ